MLHKKAGAGARQTGSRPGNTEILARGASADDIHGRQFRPVQLGDVPHMEHVGEVMLCHLNGKGFDFACPDRLDARPDRSEGEAANPIEKAS